MVIKMNYYVCPICGNVIEKVVDHGIPIYCCGKEMKLLSCGDFPELKAKHVPVAHYENDYLTVEVGMIPHPMLPEHHIDFITISFENRTERIDLKVPDQPQASFYLPNFHGTIFIEAYCNIHGLWCSEYRID